MNLMNGLASQDLTKAQGSNFQAAQFSGMLRCSLYGDISQITFSKFDSLDILVRNYNGSRIWDPAKDQLLCMTILCMINYYFKIQFYSLRNKKLIQIIILNPSLN